MMEGDRLCNTHGPTRTTHAYTRTVRRTVGVHTDCLAGPLLGGTEFCMTERLRVVV